MKLWKYSGIFLIITSIMHILVALLMSKDDFVDMFHNGIFNSVTNDKYAFAFWFLIVGFVCFFFGHTLHYYIKNSQKPAPKFLGYYLLIFGIVGAIFVPVAGFWLFIPQGLIIMLAKYEQ